MKTVGNLFKLLTVLSVYDCIAAKRGRSVVKRMVKSAVYDQVPPWFFMIRPQFVHQDYENTDLNEAWIKKHCHYETNFFSENGWKCPDLKDDTYRMSTRCGASMVTTKILLTAAHCLFDKRALSYQRVDFPYKKVRSAAHVNIYENKNNKNVQNGRQPDFQSFHYEVHDKYNILEQTSIDGNDIAMIHFDGTDKLDKSNCVRLPPNPPKKDRNFKDNEFRTIGIGYTDYVDTTNYFLDVSGLKKADNLRYIDVNIMSNDECNIIIYPSYILGEGSNFCIKGTENFMKSEKIDSPLDNYDQTVNINHRGNIINEKLKHKNVLPNICSGDSGSPLMRINERDGSTSNVLYGILSMTHGNCFSELLSGIVTDVSYHMEWIEGKYFESLDSPLSKKSAEDWRGIIADLYEKYQ